MNDLLENLERNCKRAGRHKLVTRICDYMLKKGYYTISAGEIQKIADEIDEEEMNNAKN